MTSVIYTVRVPDIDPSRIGSEIVLEVIPSTLDRPTWKYDQHFVESMDRLTTQRTTTARYRELVLAQEGITFAEADLWDEFINSQMTTNDTFELDALDVPAIAARFRCILLPGDNPSPYIGCTHVGKTVTARVTEVVA